MQTVFAMENRIEAFSQHDDITYEATTDWELIKQYFQLRIDVYERGKQGKVKGLLGQGKIDSYDFQSHFIIARKGDECIGGTRLVVRTAGSHLDIPLEGGVFSLEDYLPELQLENVAYGESGRTVVKEEYRTGKHTEYLFKLTLAKARELGCQYLFGVAPLSQARLYRIAYKNVGLNATIRDDIRLPEKPTDENVRVYLLMARIQSEQRAGTVNRRTAQRQKALRAVRQRSKHVDINQQVLQSQQ